MSPTSPFTFMGRALGAYALFHTLDDVTGLKHEVPNQAESLLAPTGGLVKATAGKQKHTAHHPRTRTLFSLDGASSSADGRTVGSRYETEVSAEIDSIEFVEQLRIGLIKVHMLSTFTPAGIGPDKGTKVVTNGTKIEEVWLGNVQAKIELDDEPVKHCGTATEMLGFYPSLTPAPSEDAKAPAVYCCSIVRGITLAGPEKEKAAMTINGYTIVWNGFGKIILGEVRVSGEKRQLTMVRLAMGSSAGGNGSAGDVQSNGSMSTT